MTRNHSVLSERLPLGHRVAEKRVRDRDERHALMVGHRRSNDGADSMRPAETSAVGLIGAARLWLTQTTSGWSEGRDP